MRPGGIGYGTAFCAVLLAVAGRLDARRLPIRAWTIEDGLPRNHVSMLRQDSRGFLWIGTSDGLTRFDGRRLVTYDTSSGLPDSSVHDLVETPEGSLWVATAGGLALFDPTTAHDNAVARPGATPRFRTFPLGSSSTLSVQALLLDRRGRLWAATTTGLFVREGEAFRGIPLVRPNLHVHALAEDAEGTLWIATSSGLLRRLPDGRILQYAFEPRAAMPEVRSLLVDRAGRLWISRYETVTVLRPTPGTHLADGTVRVRVPRRCYGAGGRLPLQEGDACEVQADGRDHQWGDFFEDSSGRVWRGWGDGVCATGDDGLECYGPRDGLTGGTVGCLLEDRQGHFWMGTDHGGVLRIAWDGLVSYDKDDGLTRDRIAGFFESEDDRLYVLASGHLFYRYDGDRFTVFRPRIPPDIDYLGWGWHQILVADRSGGFWLGTGKGLLYYPRALSLERLADVTPRVFTTRDGLASDDVFRLFEDSRGDLWISGASIRGDNLTRRDAATGEFRAEDPGGPFSGISPTAFAEDSAGNVWIGFYGGGLARVRRGRFEHFPPDGRMPPGLVRDLRRDSAGRLWAATAQSGVVRITDPAADSPVFRVYTTAHGLSSNRVHAIAEDLEGRLYFASTRGIDRLDPATGRMRAYSIIGEPTTAHRDRAGRLWFGTLSGLARLEPGIDPVSSPISVRIGRLRVGAALWPLSDLGETDVAISPLGSNRSPIAIDFFSLPFGQPQPQLFRYQLEGADTDWSPPTSQGAVEYARLSPGTYRFRVRAVGADGRPVSDAASVAFRILPPFWRRAWFIAAVALATVVLLLLAHRVRVARLLEVERVRTRIAADLHDDLGTSLYRISILSELAGRRLGSAGPDSRRLLSEIGETARDLIESAGDMIWSADPRRDDLESLAARVRHYASEMLEAEGVRWSLDGPDGSPRVLLAAETRRHLYLIFKEAIRNALRHGRATHVSLRLAAIDGRLRAEIQDDGRGFAADLAASDGQRPGGYGLGTMRERAESLGGDLRIESTPAEGTRIFVDVPLPRRA